MARFKIGEASLQLADKNHPAEFKWLLTPEFYTALVDKIKEGQQVNFALEEPAMTAIQIKSLIIPLSKEEIFKQTAFEVNFFISPLEGINKINKQKMQMEAFSRKPSF